MKPKEFRDILKGLIEQGYLCLTPDEIASEIDEAFVQVTRDKGWPSPKKGMEWSDTELALILHDAPIKKNIAKYARLLGRSYESVDQVYRWASTSNKDIKNKGRSKDRFVQQIKRIAQQTGWRV